MYNLTIGLVAEGEKTQKSGGMVVMKDLLGEYNSHAHTHTQDFNSVSLNLPILHLKKKVL